jgi:phage-related protein
MVCFGNYELPNAQQVQIEIARVEIERSVPGRNVSYHSDQTTKARTVKVAGDIRAGDISTARFWIELLRRLSDDTERVLDLDDGQTPTFNAKLTDPSYALDSSLWHNYSQYWVSYSVTLLEVP